MSGQQNLLKLQKVMLEKDLAVKKRNYEMFVFGHCLNLQNLLFEPQSKICRRTGFVSSVEFIFNHV